MTFCLSIPASITHKTSNKVRAVVRAGWKKS